MSVSQKLATHPITDTGKDACFSLLMVPSETPKSLCKKNIYILCSQVKNWTNKKYWKACGTRGGGREVATHETGHH